MITFENALEDSETKIQQWSLTDQPMPTVIDHCQVEPKNFTWIELLLLLIITLPKTGHLKSFEKEKFFFFFFWESTDKKIKQTKRSELVAIVNIFTVSLEFSCVNVTAFCSLKSTKCHHGRWTGVCYVVNITTPVGNWAIILKQSSF